METSLRISKIHRFPREISEGDGELAEIGLHLRAALGAILAWLRPPHATDAISSLVDGHNIAAMLQKCLCCDQPGGPCSNDADRSGGNHGACRILHPCSCRCIR